MYRLEPARQGRTRIPPMKRRFDVLQDHRHERPVTRRAHGPGLGRPGLLAPFLLAAAIPLAGAWGIPSDLDPVLAGSWYASARPVLERTATVEALYRAGPTGDTTAEDAPLAFDLALNTFHGGEEDGAPVREPAVPGGENTGATRPGPESLTDSSPGLQAATSLLPQGSLQPGAEQGSPGTPGQPAPSRARPAQGHRKPRASTQKARACSQPEALYRKARLCQRYGKYELAARLYQELLQASPADRKALAGLADLYIDRSSYKQAYPLLQELAGREPPDPEVLINLAVAEIALGMPEKALSDLDRAASLPHAPAFQVDFHRAVALGRLQRFEEALSWYKRCEELEPNHEDLLFNTAVAYDRLGLYEQAVTYYARYLAAAVSLSVPERRDVEARIGLLAAYVRGQAAPPGGIQTRTDRGDTGQ